MQMGKLQWKDGNHNIADAIRGGEIAMAINTPTGSHSQADSFLIRRAALVCKAHYFTTMAGSDAAVEGIEHLRREELGVRSLQE